MDAPLAPAQSRRAFTRSSSVSGLMPVNTPRRGASDSSVLPGCLILVLQRHPNRSEAPGVSVFLSNSQEDFFDLKFGAILWLLFSLVNFLMSW